MRAMVLVRPGELERAERVEPASPGAGEALVRIRRVGVCGTDLHAYRGRQPFFAYPRILGHELGAEVMEVGAGVESVRPGDRVAVEPYLECGKCPPCRRGRYNCCEQLRVLGVHLDGGMCERLCLPAGKLHRSHILSLDQLALVETLAIGAHAVARAEVMPGERVLVAGAGPIGLATALAALLAGGRVALLECDPGRRHTAAELLRPLAAVAGELIGVFAPPDAAAPSASPLAAIAGQEAFPCVVDATGSRASMEAAFSYPGSGGRLVFVGFQPQAVSFANPEFHRRELSLLSSRNSTAIEFAQVMRWLESGTADVGHWVTHRAGYDDLAAAVPGWLEPASGVVKAVLELH